MSATATSLQIYGVPLSVHTRKVIVAARLKSIPYQVVPVVPVVPGNPPPNWRAISPTGMIPAIDDAGYVLADSTAIALYLERKQPAPPLVPAALADYGRALFLDAWAGSELFRRVVHPVFHNQVVAPNIHGRPGDQTVLDTALGTAVPDAFSYLESLAPRDYLVGGALTLADLAVVSNLITYHYLGHRIDGDRFPRLAAYFRRHLASEVIAPVVAAEQPFVDNLQLDRSWSGA